MPKIVKKFGVFIIGTALIVVGVATVNPALIAIGIKVQALGFAIGVSSLAASIFIKKPKIDLGGIFDRLHLSVNPNANGKWVFGLTAAGTDIVFADVTGTKKDRSVQIVLAAFHQINSFQRFWINDELITFTGTAANGAWAGVLSRDTRLGTASQLAISSLTSSAWPTTAQGLGLAHYSLEYKLGSDKLSSGIPTRITAEIEGALVYDPRLDTTVGGSGLHRANDQTTWAFINVTNQIGRNWVLIVLHYILGWRLNGKLAYGIGADPADIDYPQWIAMANVADELVDAKPRYRVGGIFDLDGNHERILGELEALIGAKIGRFGGKWTVWVPNDDLIAFNSIGESDLLREAGVSFQPAGPVEDLFNVSRGTYVDPESIYQIVEYPEVREAAAVTEDGGDRILELDLPMIQDREIAERTARERVRRTRFSGTWKFALGPKGLLFRPFDVTTITIQETNNLPIIVRILAMDYTLQGVVGMEVIEEDASIYDTTLPLGTPITQLDPGAFDPATAIAVTGLAAVPVTITGSSNTATDVLKITWDDPGGFVAETQVQIRVTGTVDWHSISPEKVDVTLAFTGPLEPGTQYDVQARHITIYGVIGPWSTLINATAGTQGLIRFVSSWLDNQTHTVAADDDGTNYSLVNAGGTFHVRDNIANIDVTGAGPVYSVLNGFPTGAPVAFFTVDGLRMTMNAVTGVYTLSDDPTWVDPGNIGNAYMLRAVYNGITQDLVYTIIKSLGGVNAKVLSISGTSQNFKYDSAGVFVGDPTITFTALQQGSTAPMVWLTQKFNPVSGDWDNTTINRMSAATGLTSNLTEAAFAAEGEIALRVWAHFEDPSGQFHIDTMTVTRIQDGAAGFGVIDNADFEQGDVGWTKQGGWTIVQTAEARSGLWAAQFTGSTASLINKKMPVAPGDRIKATGHFKGTAGTDGTARTRLDWLDSADVFISQTTSLAISPSTAYQLGIADGVAPANAASVQLSGRVFSRTVGTWFADDFSIAQAGVDGAEGLSIAELQIFIRAATAPATPTGGSYDFGTQVLTPPTSWSSAIPAGNDPVYASRSVASVAGQTGVDTTLTWSGPVKALSDGESVDIIFKRSATQPATPAASAGVPTGWFSDVNSVPAGADPIWSSVGTRANAGQNWTWQTPVKIEGQDGADGSAGPAGANTATVFLYQRTSSATPPATPAASKTYTFATGVLTSAAPWTQNVPAASASLPFLWVTTAVATSSGTTDDIAPAEWATPVIQNQDGIQTRAVFIYQRTTTSTPPATPTTASATYTFSTGVLSAVNNGWTQAIPASGGGFLWVSQATALASALATTDSITSGEWSTAVLLAQDGADAAGGSSLVRINTNGLTATALSPANATILWQLDNDGNEKKAVNGGALSNIAAWLLSGTAGSYSARATLISGTFLTGTFNTWLNLGTDRSWSVTDTTTVGGSVIGTLKVDIRLDSTGNIEVSKTFSLEAEKVV